MSTHNKYKHWIKMLNTGERDSLKEEGAILFIKATKPIELYKIDKGIIPQSIKNQNKCDYMLFDRPGLESKLIELKGTDEKHACDQIYDTITYFEANDDTKEFVNGVNLLEGYIVSPNGKVPDINNSHRKKLCDKLSRKSHKKHSNFLDHLIFVRCVNKIPGNYKPERNSNKQLLVNNDYPLIV